VTRKHFVEIADILSAARPTMSDAAHHALVNEFASFLGSQNTRFDYAKFKLAASDLPETMRKAA
jgi:hypothetical protein